MASGKGGLASLAMSLARHCGWTLDDVLRLTPSQLTLCSAGLLEVLRAESGGDPDKEPASDALKKARQDDIEQRIKRAKAKGLKGLPLDRLLGQSYGRK